MTTTDTHMHPCRQRRLMRGWEPVQLIGRMKILAARDGVELPKTYELLRELFLWEQHRTPMPGYYAGLLHRILDTPNPFGVRPVQYLPTTVKAARTRAR